MVIAASGDKLEARSAAEAPSLRPVVAELAPKR
jgi:hypothetical protein